MSWKMRHAGWNRGMKRVYLGNGRYTYRHPGQQQSGVGTVIGTGLVFMLPSMAGGPVGLIVFGPILFLIGLVVGAVLAATTKP